MGLVKAQRQRVAVASEHQHAYTRAYRAWVRSMRAPETIAKLEAALRHRLPPADAARALPWWDARDPHGPWGAWHSALTDAYVNTMRASGAQARGDVRRALVQKTWLPPGHARVHDLVGPLMWNPATATPQQDMRAAAAFFTAKARRPASTRTPEITVPISRYSVEWIRREAADKLRQSSEEQVSLVRGIIARGYEKGTRPEDMAKDIRRVIGLNERQAASVERRRAAVLERTDDPEKADSAADKYADEQVAYRADVIARNENHEAQEQGRLDEWREARDAGELPTETQRKWVAMPSSDRLCEICADLDGQTVGLDEPFYSDVLGEELDGPGAHVMCRCTTVLEFET